jgi:predicted unusual protein kinase regulating ubiquinone biosynthesis (AarF/ABC1/UbiB family)
MNTSIYKDYCNERARHYCRVVMRFAQMGWFLCCVAWFAMKSFIDYYFSADKRAYMREVCADLAKKNVLYVKLFQSVALNANWIDDILHEELLTYTDNVYWETAHINWDMIYILETEHDFVFEDGYTPINTGMISIVFKVTDRKTGDILAVKMKRLGIEERLRVAIEEFSVLARVASYVPLFKTFQLDKVIEENIRTIKDQTNFEVEIQNMVEVQRNCRAINYIKIPNVKMEFKKYCDNIIVMEFIKGVTVSKVSEEDKIEFSKILIKFTYINLLIHGAMHADLHAGNVMFIKNENCGADAVRLKARRTPKYQLGVIDFGILIRISEEFKGDMYDLFEKVQTVPAREFVETAMFIMYDIEQYLPRIGDEHYERMIRDPIVVVDKVFYGENGSDVNMLFEIFSILYFIQDYLKRNKVLDAPLEMKPEFIKMQTILAMNQGVVTKLCGAKCISLVNEVFKETFGSAMPLIVSDKLLGST